MKRKPTAVLGLLMVFALACNFPLIKAPTPTGEVAQVTPGTQETPTEAPTTTTEALPPASVTPTPPPDVQTDQGCTLNSAYVADVTIPDDTKETPGAAFRKTWRVRNSGTCDWESGTKLIFVSGAPLGGPPAVIAPAATAGSTVDVSVDFVAPTEPGTYRSNWQFQSPDGTRFGALIYVRIVVPGPTETPTATPTLTPTPTQTPTPGPTLPPGCVVPDAQFKDIVDQARALGVNVSCAIGSPVDTAGAFQEYWANVEDSNPHTHYRTLMIWRSDNKKIFVVQGQDTGAYQAKIAVYNDTWEESQPEVFPACSTLEAPTGYIRPIRGFGKLWCLNNYATSVGWPNQAEAVVTLTVQQVDNGMLMKVAGPPVTYFVAMDFQLGAATVLMTP